MMHSVAATTVLLIPPPSLASIVLAERVERNVVSVFFFLRGGRETKFDPKNVKIEISRELFGTHKTDTAEQQKKGKKKKEKAYFY